jgi:hypothetical protein
VYVTASCNELLYDGRVPFIGREVQSGTPILILKIDVTASCKKLFRDGLIDSPILV